MKAERETTASAVVSRHFRRSASVDLQRETENRVLLLHASAIFLIEAATLHLALTLRCLDLVVAVALPRRQLPVALGRIVVMLLLPPPVDEDDRGVGGGVGSLQAGSGLAGDGRDGKKQQRAGSGKKSIHRISPKMWKIRREKTLAPVTTSRPAPSFPARNRALTHGASSARGAGGRGRQYPFPAGPGCGTAPGRRGSAGEKRSPSAAHRGSASRRAG